MPSAPKPTNRNHIVIVKKQTRVILKINDQATCDMSGKEAQDLGEALFKAGTDVRAKEQ